MGSRSSWVDARSALRAVVVVVVLTKLTACTPPPATQPAPVTPPKGGFRPAGPAASSYATAAPRDLEAPPADPLRAAFLEEVRALARRAGRPAPVADPRLDWVMTDLARQLRGNDRPALEIQDFLLAHYGLPEPSPHLLLLGTTVGGETQLRIRARGEIAAMLRESPGGRIGVGMDRDGDTVYIAVGLQESHLELLRPIARELPGGGRQPILARIDRGFFNPSLIITGPDGRVAEQAFPLQDRTFSGEMVCRAQGRHQVEIAAVGLDGPAVLANFPVYCGTTAPADSPGPAGASASTGTAAEVEAALVALIGRDRQRGGLGPVSVDPRLVDIARAHSRDMADHNFVSHLSPRSGSTEDRVHAAGLTPTLLMENVGRAYSADEAEAGFLSSPGHRGNLLDPRARRVGVGVAFGPPVTGTRPVFVTQLFTD